MVDLLVVQNDESERVDFVQHKENLVGFQKVLAHIESFPINPVVRARAEKPFVIARVFGRDVHKGVFHAVKADKIQKVCAGDDRVKKARVP